MMSAPVEKIKTILNKPSTSRTPEDIREIAAHVFNIKFFETLRENKAVFNECCAYLSYECFGPEEFIFKIGDYGDKFYILIQGEVSVLVPVKSESSELKEIIKFKSGNSFGELALLDNKPRAASIRTIQTSHFAVLDQSNYQRILASIMKQKKMELVDFLQTQSIFKSFTKGSLAKLSYCFEEKTFRKDFVLFNEAAKVDFLYLVKSGEVKLTKKIAMKKIDFEGTNKYKEQLNKRFSQKAEISIMGEGEFLGVYDIDKGFYANTAICSSNFVIVLKIFINDFMKRMNIREIHNTIKQRKQLKDAIHESSILSITKVIHDRESSPYRKINLSSTPSNGRKVVREYFSPSNKFTFDRFSAISRQKIENESKSMTEYLITITKAENRPKSHARLNLDKNSEDHGIKNSAGLFMRLEPFGKKKKSVARKPSALSNIHKPAASVKHFQASRFFAKTKELLNERLLQSRDNE